MSQTKAQLISDLVQALNFTGTASAPANGLFLSASNQLKLATASTERLKIDGTEVVVNDTGASVDFRVEGDTDANLLFVDASADNVGIGTISAGGKLAILSNASTYEGLELQTPSGDASGEFHIGVHQSGATSGRTIVISRGGSDGMTTESLRIDQHGQVGIGVTPDTWSTGQGITIGTSQATLWGTGDQINLSGNAYFNSGWKAAASKAGASQIEQALGNIDFKVSGSVTADSAISFDNAMRIKSDGNVGIGTTNPTSQLHVVGGTGVNLLLNAATHDASTANQARVQLGFVHSGGQALGHLRLDEGGGNSFDGILRLGVPYNNGSGGSSTREVIEADFNGNICFPGSTTVFDTTARTNGLQLYYETDSGIATIASHSSGGNTRLDLGTNSSGGAVGIGMTIRETGNVGIGTTSPGDNLDIASSVPTLRLTDTDGGPSYHQIKGPGNGDLRISCDVGNTSSSASEIQFDIHDSNKMVIQSTGNVGIGTTSPGQKLGVSGNIRFEAADPTLEFNNGGAMVYARSANTLQFASGGGPSSPQEKLRIDSNGNLLIGTTSSEDTTGNSGPKIIHTGDLQIDGDQKSILFRSTNSTAQKQSGIQWWNENGAGVQCAIFGVREAILQAPTALAFYTSDNVDTSSNSGQGNITNRMLINSVGEFRVQHENTSNNVVSSDQVHGIGNSSLNSVTSNLARLAMQERQGNWISFRDGSGTHYGTISRNASNVVYGGQSSDYRIKENIVNVSNGITLLKQLRPVNFNYSSDSGFTTEEQAIVRIGFIAHEYAEVCPTGVIGEKDGMDIWGDCTDSEGKTTQTHVPESKKLEGETWTEKSRTPDYQQIDFSKAVPILTAALQEAISKIETLETKVAALEAA